MRHAAGVVREALELIEAGMGDRAIGRELELSPSTVRNWRRGHLPASSRPVSDETGCPVCGALPHPYDGIPPAAYSYLLGLYLGDGCIVKNGTNWTLRIYLDNDHPGVIEEAARTVRRVAHDSRVFIGRHGTSDCSVVHATWKAWPCLFPQHGAGRKHHRPIELARWQQEIVDLCPGALLRGLIHSDGWRGVNRVTAKGKVYEYPRYQFSNRSDDIREIFCSTCDKLDIEWRPWTRFHISVAKREAVERLDEHVGLKY